MVCSFVRNVLCEEQSLSKEIKLAMGCCMHFCVLSNGNWNIKIYKLSKRKIVDEEFKNFSLPVIGLDS